MTTSHGRSTRRFKRLRTEFKAWCEAYERACWLCGKPIDYTLDFRHPDAFTVDHALPLSTHHYLAEDVANFRPAHAACNKMRGNAVPHIPIGKPSEDW